MASEVASYAEKAITPLEASRAANVGSQGATHVMSATSVSLDAKMTGAQRWKLFKGAMGIYFFFINYGRFQEDVFKFASPSGQRFTSVWFLQFIDAVANTLVGLVGRQYYGATGGAGVPHQLLVCSGLSQVVSKYLLSASLAAGLSFSVATLVKSAKMVPVMVGSLALGGARFSPRQLLQSSAIVAGTSIVNLSEGRGQKKKSTALGMLLVMIALVTDGITGGVQKKTKTYLKTENLEEKPYDMMFWTNVYMALASAGAAVLRSEMQQGAAFCRANPRIASKILKFALCGAMGQSCIYYTIANFDTVVCTAITTTRKLASVLVSLAGSSHALPASGKLGVAVAAAGMMGEVL